MAQYTIEIDVPTQTLTLKESVSGNIVLDILVSTAKNGVGEKLDSEQTPRGKHKICACIGETEPMNSVFVGRQPTGELYSEALRAQHPHRDWILTRILWLEGCEINKNKNGDVDTRNRYIYIHGAPGDVEMGVPGSHGCIRLRNEDIVRLYDMVNVGTPVNITGEA